MFGSSVTAITKPLTGSDGTPVLFGGTRTR